MVAHELKVLLVAVTVGIVAHSFSRSEIVEVVDIELAVTDIDRSVAFFKQLDFEVLERGDDHARLALGDERLILRERNAVRPAASNDLSFQHIAIVVTDMDAAFARIQMLASSRRARSSCPTRTATSPGSAPSTFATPTATPSS